jgi:hypothetical protein
MIKKFDELTRSFSVKNAYIEIDLEFAGGGMGCIWWVVGRLKGKIRLP